MNKTDAETTVMGLLAAADAGDVEKLVSYCSADAKHYFGGMPISNDELKKRVAAFKAAFPDIRRDFKVVSNHDGVVTLQGWVPGTNSGPFMGQPATGNKIKISGLGLYKLDAQGKVTEGWVELDSAALVNQLKGG